jgi:hypothetical protein
MPGWIPRLNLRKWGAAMERERYDYLAVKIKVWTPLELTEKLNEYAEQGWDLYLIHPQQEHVYIFKKEKTPR